MQLKLAMSQIQMSKLLVGWSCLAQFSNLVIAVAQLTESDIWRKLTSGCYLSHECVHIVYCIVYTIY